MALAKRKNGVIHLSLSEEEAQFIKRVTQNCLLYDGGMHPEDMHEPSMEEGIRDGIFEVLSEIDVSLV